MKKLQLAVNIPENQVSFHQFNDDFGLKGKALMQRLRGIISMPVTDAADNAILDTFKSPDTGLTAVAFGGSIPLVENLMDIRTFLTGETLRFALIEANEIALVNLVRATFDLAPTEITVIIYIGREFSNIIILKGYHPLSFVQAIHEGYNFDRVCNTLFSRILLEQEESNIPDIHRIVLAGEIGSTNAYEFFTKQFPEIDVEPITTGSLDISHIKAEDLALLPNFAIPIAMAWEALDRKNPRFLRLNLMPESIRSYQKFFKIAWHGFAMLGLIFALMVLLSYQTLVRWSAMKSTQYSIHQKQETILSLQADLARIGVLQEQIDNYEQNLRFLDKQIVDPGKWSRLFSKISEDFESVGNIWLESIESIPQGFRIVGKSQFRNPIPRLAYLLPNTDLKRVVRVVSEEGGMTYEFEMTAGIPQPETPLLNSDLSEIKTTTGTVSAAENKWWMEQTGTAKAQSNPTSNLADTSKTLTRKH
jgi:hypothetical protein